MTLNESPLEFTPNYKIGEEYATQFAKHLNVNKDAKEYLAERGIGQAFVDECLVGYNPPFSDYRAPLLKGRIVVPIRDVHGRVLGFAGRKYDPMAEMAKKSLWDTFSYKPSVAEKMVNLWEHGKWINEKFPKGRHLFNLHRAKEFIRQSNYAVLVEGYFDSFVLTSKHLPENGALCGAALSEMHLALLSRYCEHVVMLLDGDAAGAKGTEAALPLISDFGLKPHVIILPPKYDPDDFVLKYGGKQLRRIIEHAVHDNKEQVKINV